MEDRKVSRGKAGSSNQDPLVALSDLDDLTDGFLEQHSLWSWRRPLEVFERRPWGSIFDSCLGIRATSCLGCGISQNSSTSMSSSLIHRRGSIHRGVTADLEPETETAPLKTPLAALTTKTRPSRPKSSPPRTPSGRGHNSPPPRKTPPCARSSKRP